jgi:peptidoglycan/LPS O-acetylase OafA/YrhL
MPISIGLLLCLPIGILFFFEARWLIRYAVGRYEQRERRAARIFGIFGASLIPLMYCFGRIEGAFPGRLGKAIAMGFFMVVICGLVLPTLATLEERKKD